MFPFKKELCSYNCIEHGYYFKNSKRIQFDGSWPERNSELSFCGKCQHFSNTVIFKKSPNSCSQPAFLASSVRHNAKTQQKDCLLIVYAHHVYKTCTLFLIDSSRGCTTSSVFRFHRFSKGLGYSKLAVSQNNHKSTMTRSSLLLCVASPRQHFGEHNVFILYAPLASAGSFLCHYDLKEFLK